MSEICTGVERLDLNNTDFSESIVLDSDLNVTCHCINIVDSIFLDVRFENSSALSHLSLSSSIVSVFVTQSNKKLWELIVVCHEISDLRSCVSSRASAFWTKVNMSVIDGFDIESIQNAVIYVRKSDSSVKLMFSATTEDSIVSDKKGNFIVELNISDWQFEHHTLNRVITKEMVSLSSFENGIIRYQRLSGNRAKKIVTCSSRGVIAVHDETDKLFLLDIETEE
jgi:hypothetical protein